MSDPLEPVILIGDVLNPEYAALAGKRLERWWEKPTRTREEQVEGQLGLEIG